MDGQRLKLKKNHETALADFVLQIFQQNSGRSIRDILAETYTLMNNRACNIMSDGKIEKMSISLSGVINSKSSLARDLFVIY